MSRSFAAPDIGHKHKFSLTHFIHFSYLSDGLTFAYKPYDSRPISHIYPAMFHGRVADQHKFHLEPKLIEAEAIELEDLEPRNIELERNLGTDPYQIQERSMRNDFQNLVTADMDEFGIVGAEMSYIPTRLCGKHCRLGP